MERDMRILLVDDSRSMRRIIRAFLARRGWDNVLEAGNGQEALEILDRAGADLIVSDLHMPVMDGMAFLAAVKEHPGFRQIPFVMLTVEAIQKTMNKALAMGVDSYVVKPVKEATFIAELERVLRLGESSE